MVELYLKKADKITVLRFILEREMVTIYDLMDEFEYEYEGARSVAATRILPRRRKMQILNVAALGLVD